MCIHQTPPFCTKSLKIPSPVAPVSNPFFSHYHQNNPTISFDFLSFQEIIQRANQNSHDYIENTKDIILSTYPLAVFLRVDEGSSDSYKGLDKFLLFFSRIRFLLGLKLIFSRFDFSFLVMFINFSLSNNKKIEVATNVIDFYFQKGV